MSILDKLYTDRLKIKRSMSYTDEFGGSFEEYKEVASDVPCRLSQRYLREVIVSNGVSQSKQDYKVFAGLACDVRQNDLLELTRQVDGSKYYFKASKPMSYELTRHKEVFVSEISQNEFMGDDEMG